MKTDSDKQTLSSWKVTTSAFVLALLLGVGILVGFATQTQNAHAQQAPDKQTRDTPSASDDVNSPDCGPNWVDVSSPNQSASSNILSGVAVVSSSDVWAVGDYNNGTTEQTLTEHWNGSTWTVVYSPNPSASYNILFGVAAVASGNLRVVGSFGNSGASHTLIEHGDGTSWSLVSSPDGGTTDNGLFGVAVVSGNDVWAVGSYSNANNINRTLIIRYNPCSATATPTRTPTPHPSQTPGGPTATPIPAATATATPATCSLQFTDVQSGSTFYSYIQCLACRGIINGYPCSGPGEPCNGNNDPYFRPNAKVTRGQIAKVVALSAAIQTSVSGQTFEDVPPGSTFYIYTEQLYTLGAMNG